VRHPDHGFLDAQRAGALNQMVEHRDHREPAFAGEALLPDVFGMEISLERFRRREALQNVALLFGGVRGLRPYRLQPLLNEALGRRVEDVHVLGTQGAAIGVPERLDDRR